MGNWLEEIGTQLWSVAEVLGREARGNGVISLLRPVAPFNRPNFLAPAITVGALLSFLILSGVAVASLGALLTALLALYLLLVDVFGVTIELHPLGVR
jgi:hypothetical protein